MRHLTHKNYRGSVNFSSDDDLLVGEILGINDVVGYHGTSIAEIKANFRQAVDEYLDFCTEVGKTPDKEYKGEFVVRIENELHRRLAILAASENTSLNKIVERAIIKETSYISKKKPLSTVKVMPIVAKEEDVNKSAGSKYREKTTSKKHGEKTTSNVRRKEP